MMFIVYCFRYNININNNNKIIKVRGDADLRCQSVPIFIWDPSLS